jgi:hypothetical protein
MSKIAIFFGNANLLEMHHLSTVSGLERPFSDHTPWFGIVGNKFKLALISNLKGHGCMNWVLLR